MKNLIERYLAERRIDEALSRVFTKNSDSIGKQILDRIPSAQPELIRCKDCKHMIEHKSYGDMGESAYTCEGNMDGWVLPDSYCSYAKRRADDSISD